MFNRVLITAEEARHTEVQLVKGLSLVNAGGHAEWFMTVFHPAFEAAISDDSYTESEARQLYVRHRQNQIDRHLSELELEVDVAADLCWHPSFLSAIIRQAKRYEPDLMLIPRRENQDLVEWLVGGDEQDLVRQLKGPLLFANEKPWPEHLRIAVALNPFHLDDRDDSLERHLLRTADQLAESLSAELHVVHCFNSLPQAAIFDEHMVTDYASLQARVGAEHRERIEALLDTLDRPVGGPLLQLLEGEVQDEMPQFVEQQQIDLLILGTSEHSLMERLLLGSTTERLLARVDTDVMVLQSIPKG